jgi:hypothetical protein
MLIYGVLQEYIRSDNWTVFLYHGPSFPVIRTCQFLHMHYVWVCCHDQIPHFQDNFNWKKYFDISLCNVTVVRTYKTI